MEVLEMAKTKIEWCQYSINPVKGLCPMDCKNNQGKPYCYARRMYKRFHWDEWVRWYPTAWDLVDTLKEPSRIFVGSTFELFHDSLPEYWMEYNLLTAKEYPQHTFIFLTKCPQNLPKEWPDNCWVGVSATDRAMAIEAIVGLGKVKASVKFISFEPLLSDTGIHHSDLWNGGINWVICGQCTPVKASTMPKIEWIKEIVEAADKARVPVYLKNDLQHLLTPDHSGYGRLPDWAHGKWDGKPSPVENELRQEIPG